jgi:hypothetical protein
MMEKKPDGLVLVCPACYAHNVVKNPESGSVDPPSGTIYVCLACGNGRMEYPADLADDLLDGENVEDVIQKKIDEHDLNTEKPVSLEEIEQMIDEKIRGIA